MSASVMVTQKIFNVKFTMFHVTIAYADIGRLSL